MKVKEIRDLSSDELKAKMVTLKEELFNLRFQLAINQLDNPARIREVRRSIAKVKTVMRQQELKAQ